MSVLSGISRLSERQGRMRNSAQTEKTMSDKAQRLFRDGFYLICLMAAAGLALPAILSKGEMPSAWAFSVGIEAFSIVASAIVYYCYMQDPDSAEKHTVFFSTLLIANTAGLFLDECAWLMQGAASMAVLNRVANTLLYLCNCVIVILFWRYAAYMLQIREKLAHAINRVLSWLFALIFALLVVNCFVPLIFSVDAAGFYRREALFPLTICPVLVVLAPLTQGFMEYSGPVKVKRVARLFFLMPIIGVALTCVQFGISTQYSAVLLSILLALGVIVADRGKRMAVTRTELGMAMQIQESMLPDSLPTSQEHPEFDLCASMDPAREVGGDFYDLFFIDDDHLALVIADVSDKGVPAALLMMSAKILIHYRARRGGTPAEILADVNDEMCEKNDAGMFVTVWMGILDIRNGTMVCVNAGHENPAVRRDGEFRMFQDKHGLAVGVMPGIRYRDYTLEMRPGDSVFVYTDGVPEANNEAAELYGVQRLEHALNHLADPSPQGVLQGVRADVDAFVGTAKQFDDLTMLCVEYCGDPKADG